MNGLNPIDLNWFQPFIWANWALFVLLLVVVGFSLLVFRQAMQMTRVLPTTLSPVVRLIVSAYVAIAIVAAFLGLGVAMS